MTATMSKSMEAPKLEFDGAKWTIENYVDASELITLEEAKVEKQHVVYVYNCKNATISIPGKVNAVTFDSCQKVGLVVDRVISSLAVIDCKSVQVQISGVCPTLSIDKTDGIEVYLSHECLDGVSRIFTAKSSAMNVLFPSAQRGEPHGTTATTEEPDAMTEKPIPEQYCTIVDASGQLITTPTLHTAA